MSAATETSNLQQDHGNGPDDSKTAANGANSRPMSPADSHLGDEHEDSSLTDSSGKLSPDGRPTANGSTGRAMEAQTATTITTTTTALDKLNLKETTTTTTNNNNNNNSVNNNFHRQADDEGHESMSSTSGDSEQVAPDKLPCSAIHALERDMPDFDYQHLIVELRRLIVENIEQNAGLYSQREILKCREDDWFLTRFLLRHKMDVNEAFEQLKRTMRYHNESLCSLMKPEDFPAEFYQLGGTFSYEPDRKGNQMMYMRVKVHRKTPEIKAVVENFLYFNLLRTDELAKGRGIALVMDCTGGGLQNADIELLFFLVSNLKNYYPRGLSYILVHNLPWILKPFWHLAKNWISDEHRELIKFSNDRTIFEFIDRENLPDFLGGTCKRSYRQPPDNCTNLQQAIKFWGIEMKVARSILAKFRDNLPQEAVENLQKSLDEMDQLMAEDTKGRELEKTPDILKTRDAK